MLYFLTGNKNKFEEMSSMIDVPMEQMDIDLPEIQGMDPREIIRAKLEAAFKHSDGPFIVEDTSLALEALNGLPGPLIKWFEKTIGNAKIADLALKEGNTKARALVCIGYARDKDTIEFFEGEIEGEVVAPRGENGFGWGPIFQPEGHERTFAEMTQEEKNAMSMRRLAAGKLAQALAAHT